MGTNRLADVYRFKVGLSYARQSIEWRAENYKLATKSHWKPLRKCGIIIIRKKDVRECRRRASTLAVTQAVHSLLMQDKDTARNTNSLTDRQLQNVVTTASGVGSVNSISASTQCVYAVCSKDDMFLQLWSTTYNRIVATLLWCGANPTGKPYANPVTIKRHGRKIRILFIHTEKPPGV